ncbi:Crp/Fnr family transcriptional regulator [uncultured Tateyamaria sp.]|uniref:Crp/Fnr family transcriptional regulator n=1 Tax=uncultured Tateyamaria sp. TaxID=455651 RepID=UPI002607CA36|nr:Crp/Fnr family transcriptional regulator [uncultured Tateyamaria sp.]
MTPDAGHPAPSDLKRKGMIEHVSPHHWNALGPLFAERHTYAANTVISRRGATLDHSLLLLDGVVARSIPRANMQHSTFVALQFKGDFVDLHAFPLKQLDHDVVAVTAATVAVIQHAALKQLLDGDIELSRMLWSLTLVDASIHRHWAMRNSSMRGFARVANFFSEIDARLAAALGQQQDTYTIGITQTDIADATGLTPVHVNRVLRDLREDGCCAIASGQLTIMDRARLHRRGDFDPAYLYLPNSDAEL